jgi:hypothetical protein
MRSTSFILIASLLSLLGCGEDLRYNESAPAIPAPCRTLASPAAEEFPRCAELMARDTNRTCAPTRFSHHAPVYEEIRSYCAELEYDDLKRSPR